MQALVRDLNSLYRNTPALYGGDAVPEGFAWVVGDDDANSVFAFLRHHNGQTALVISNMTPVPRMAYGIGVPIAGRWSERLNTDASVYGGSGVGNSGSANRSEEHTSELQSLMRISYAVFCLKKKKNIQVYT